MKILGIDLGSRDVKIVLMENDTIVKKLKVSTVKFYKEYCKYDGKIIIDFDQLQLGNFDFGISTGYGRNNVNIENFIIINELKAHAYGGMYKTGLKDFILLDAGGQDIKVLKIEKGIITDIELNDKCAASCGRYLENMAQILEVSLDELSSFHLNFVVLNSTCAVFSESELIGKIAEGIPYDQLCAGVNYSLYKRLKPMLAKFRGRRILLSGGVARNKALVEYLKQDYDEVFPLEDPEFTGAIGCCYYYKIKGYKKNEIGDPTLGGVPLCIKHWY
ncbi:acyl-CoA dehydratase activase [Thermotalea metallivorans]|uniref:R-phenyllactate dehydratase activator n=1 Tax=Thermotalea metallivorans TaxID=520762 RepID=A0A140LAA4_9FIRM|nr:acyl-CoA dehydratase activase [Thermotalea metallivorans]KXG77479.1 R-phenyllactate dehydratase activator [Thermotalea metallivorans]